MIHPRKKGRKQILANKRFWRKWLRAHPKTEK